MMKLVQWIVDATGLPPRPAARFLAAVIITAWAASDSPWWVWPIAVPWTAAIFYASGHEVFRERFNSACVYARPVSLGMAAGMLFNGFGLLDAKQWAEVFALYLLVVKDPPPPRPRHEPQPSPVS